MFDSKEVLLLVLSWAFCLDGTGALVTAPENLSCDFEVARNCTWTSTNLDLPGVSGRWTSANSVILDMWHSVPRSFDGQRFAFAQGIGSQTRSWLISDVFPCLLVPGVLTFHYWKNSFFSSFIPSGFPILNIGIRSPPTANFTRIIYSLSTVNEWGWKPFRVEVPTSLKPFQIVFEAITVLPYDVVAVDDIAFRGYVDLGLGKVCGLSETGRNNVLAKLFNQNQPLDEKSGAAGVKQHWFGSFKYKELSPDKDEFAFRQFPNDVRPFTTPPPEIKPIIISNKTPLATFATTATTISEAPSFGTTKTGFSPNTLRFPTDVCRAANCGFEENSCLFEGTDSVMGAWVIAEGRIGNILTGIPKPAFGRHYAAAYNNRTVSTQVLKSAQFVLRAPGVLTFWYYFASAQSGNLKLCDLDTVDKYCIWDFRSFQNPGKVSRFWKRAKIDLAPGKHQLFFLAEGLEPNYYVGLDSIYLRTSAQGGLLPCFPV